MDDDFRMVKHPSPAGSTTWQRTVAFGLAAAWLLWQALPLKTADQTATPRIASVPSSEPISTPSSAVPLSAATSTAVTPKVPLPRMDFEETRATAKAEPKTPAKPIDFHRDIRPIFVRHCYVCHGPAHAESGLRLDLQRRAMRGGDSGAVIVPGNSAASLLIQNVTGTSAAGIVMPPAGKAPSLAPQQIALLKLWIDQGAPWPPLPGAAERNPADQSKNPSAEEGPSALSEHWAFQPVSRVKPPALEDAWVDTPIDAFILQRLQEHRLAPNQRASRVELIRRLSFDLTGLPPSPEEVQRFLSDSSDDAYEHLVDRLLASPAYGERWARHWLDLARYADSDGFENDTDRPFAYKYRDYVIRSFNEDKPYDQFVLEQLAGDELGSANPEHLVALGFCRNGPTIGNQVNEKNRVDEVDDMVSTTGAVFLGLTVGCARCHDHKYEPITQADYYRLFAVFNNTAKANDNEIMSVRDPAEKARKTFVLLGGDATRPGIEVQPGVPAVLDNDRAHFPPPVGNVDARKTARGATAPSPGSVGRRLALARWIADRENPLTARTIVNRVWMYHFGRGLVNTPSNLGQSGDVPTHLELLDYLSRELVRSGWRLKPLHKQIVMSATYQQSSAYDPLKAGVDPENQWYWRHAMRRLEAEAIRDTMLAVSGKLNPQMYGPGVKPKIPDHIIATSNMDTWPQVDREGPAQWRRSIYIYVKRSLLVPMLESFDAPIATQTCERRMTTTVATQALQLLNDDFSNEQSKFMAGRIIRETGDDVNRQIDRAYWLAYSHPPEEAQLKQAAAFIAERLESSKQTTDGKSPPTAPTREQRLSALADFCHVLFNSNEFVYVN